MENHFMTKFIAIAVMLLLSGCALSPRDEAMRNLLLGVSQAVLAGAK
jgi:hypothetical protein